MSESFSSMDDVAQAFAEATSAERQSLFLQGQVIKRAVEDGFEVDEVCAYCGQMIRRSKRTVYKRYTVARTFQMYDSSVPYELYATACTAVDYRLSDDTEIARQQQQAQVWIEQAITKEWSVSQLKEAMRGDVVGQTESYNAIVCSVVNTPDGQLVEVLLDEESPLKGGEKVKVKIKLGKQEKVK